MTLHCTSLLAAAALAVLAAPSAAQDDLGAPPPLPDLAVETDPGDYVEDYVETYVVPETVSVEDINAAEARARWLDQCRATRYDNGGAQQYQAVGALDYCEDYLLRYEQAIAAGPSYSAVPSGTTFSYPYGPVMWVRVPIQTVRRARSAPAAAVDEYVEEALGAAPQPATSPVPVRRAAPAPTKRVRVTK